MADPIVPDYSSQLLPFIRPSQDPSTSPNYAGFLSSRFGMGPSQAMGEPMSHGEAMAHTLARGATANWSPVLKGSLDLGSHYEVLNSLTRAKAMGLPDPDGEIDRRIVQLQAELNDPMSVYRQGRDEEMNALDRAEQQWPATAYYGQIGGTLASPLPMGKAKLAGEGAIEGARVAAPWLQRLIQNARAGAKWGGLYGGVAGAGQATSEGKNLPAVTADTLIGTGIGAAGGAIFPALATRPF
jgi:hypothetical protein